MSDRIKVAIAGIGGRMGKASARMILEDSHLQLVGGFDRPGAPCAGQDAGSVAGSATAGILVSNSIEDLPRGIQPDVLLDFSIAEAAFENARRAIDMGMRPVIGTSGLEEKHIKELSEAAQRKHLGAIVVPNFSVGAVLMMEFAEQAAAYFEHVEVVEMHQPKKVDAPSGTAMHTLKRLQNGGAGKKFNQSEVKEHELVAHARGGTHDSGVKVHSLRLPGLISHQQVIFGAAGELLTIQHDSFNTDCFMKGIKMAIEGVMQLDNLVVGLDKLMKKNAHTRETVGGRTN